ncbi:MAG: FliM/FliN family flagellar motor switch protein [Pseudomonadota bacterium]
MADIPETETGAGTDAPSVPRESVGAAGPTSRRDSAVLSVPIEVTISVGKARPLISDLVSLRRDSVLALDSRIDDPVEIYIGERLIARGELQETDDGSGRLGVRLTEIEDLSDGV